MIVFIAYFIFFFFNDTATTEIYTLSLHDALPILSMEFPVGGHGPHPPKSYTPRCVSVKRSEEHTSELQSRPHLVCRLLLEKKKKHKVVTHGASGNHSAVSCQYKHWCHVVRSEFMR